MAREGGRFESNYFGAGVKLTASDVAWLAKLKGDPQRKGDMANLHLEGAGLVSVPLQGQILIRAHFESTDLWDAHFENAVLSDACFQGAFLANAHLEGARLWHAHLENADLSGAHLEGADLQGAHLEGARLSRAVFDSKTVLTEAVLDARTELRDIRWGGVGSVDLTQIDWNRVRRLGDEGFPTRIREKLQRAVTITDYEAVVRAYRQVTAQLRAQGVNEAADRFAYRAQVLQRGVHRHSRRWWAFLGSWLLDLISGMVISPCAAS